MSAVSKLISIYLFFVAGTVCAQNEKDSIRVTSETGVDQPDNYQYFSTNDFEQKTIFKLGTDARTYSFAERAIRGLALSWEQKLSKTISTELGWLAPAANQQAIFLNLRYYYNKSRKRSERSGDFLNNFNGNYFLIGASRSFTFDRGYDPVYNLGLQEESVYSLFYGRQQKVGKWGFFDLAGGFNYFTSWQQLLLSFNLKMGLAYGKFSRPKNDLQIAKYEEYKNTYEDTRGILKVSNPYMSLNSRREWGVGSTFSYERALFDNFSVTAKVDLSAFRQRIRIFSGNEMSYGSNSAQSITLDIEGRYYYRKRKDLLSGQLVRSFSGHYMLLAGRDIYSLYNGERDSDEGRKRRTTSGIGIAYYSWAIGWGSQQRIGKKGFFDFNLALDYSPVVNRFSPAAFVGAGLIIGK